MDIWFLESSSQFDCEKDTVTVYLSDYHIPSIEMLSGKAGFPISPLRYLKLADYNIRAGGAEGVVIIDSNEYTLDYAWGGLNTEEDHRKRECYTVKLTAPNASVLFLATVKKISEYEKWKLERSVADLIFPSIKRIRPYRDKGDAV